MIILTEHFEPSTGATAQLISDLANDLHHKGLSLRVLTSTPGLNSHSYKVLRFTPELPHSNLLIAKTLQGFHFFIASLNWLISHSRSYETILIVSNPPFIGLVGLLLKLLKSKKYVFLFQDIFPRSASLAGILPSRGPLFWLWKSLITRVLNASEATIVLSQSMIERCKQEFGSTCNLVSIPNWSTSTNRQLLHRKNYLSRDWGLDSFFTVQYSGNFGRLHDIITLLEVARLLQAYPIKFLFIGGGAKLNQIRAYKDAYNLQNILIKNYQPRHLLAASLAVADISVVSLIPGADDTVAPSKLYGILAASRPVLLISSPEGELARLIRLAECGTTYTPGDAVEISRYLLHLLDKPAQTHYMAMKAKALYNNKFGRSRSTEHYFELFQSLGLI